MNARWTLILLALVFCPIGVALDIGVAACDITPDVNAHVVPLAGYGAREGEPATGIHDRLHAKVLFFRDDDTQAALITADLRSITPEFTRQIAEKTRHLGVVSENLLVCASHTHAGPAMYPEPFWQFQFGAYDPAIVDAMTTSVAAALEVAVDNAAPARVGFGETMLEGFTRNRRWEYDTAAREAAGEKPFVHPRLWVMRVDDLEGTPRAILVNFATHPTIAGADNMDVSAEWPGVLQRELERMHPVVIALYTNGAEGDQAPVGAKGEDDFARIEDFGSRLAGRVQSLADQITTVPGLSVSALQIHPRLPEIKFSDSVQAGEYAHLLDSALDALPRTADLRMLRIGGTVLIGLPGEPLGPVGLAVESAVLEVGFEDAIVLGLASDYVGYIVNEEEYAHGGYEVDLRSYYGPGLGDFFVKEVRSAVEGLR
ncbi:MAG: neutral/alkaline non-lysosomal ceramidase N-terminal domain-containing protein [Candidatus Hydrogenedentes bacterium]|nr:neutral/alkaline non-lysosomal ceramidase N-terminal domain-containing protein [Candidatus Hydrogenedentota bacterium]